MSETKAVKRKRHGAKDVITKRVGVLSVVGMFYAMCCAGAFGIEEMIPEAGPGLTLVMLILLPFVWALPYSFICAELGSARPVEGGNLIWVKEALGEFWFGIMVIVNFIWGLIANTVYVVLAVSYLSKQVPINEMQAYLLKVGLILIFFIINVLGIKEVSFTSTLMSVLVFIAFLLVAVVGFATADRSPVEPFMNPDYSGNPLMAIGGALGIGLWMYSGFDEISLVAGEIKDAHRVIPKALLIVIPLMIVTYVLPTAAALASVPGGWEDWTLDLDSTGVGYHSVFANIPGALGVGMTIFFIAVAIIGQCAIYNMCIAVAGRCGLILSDEHFGPKALAKLSSSRGTPVISLIIVVIVTTALLGTPHHQLDFKFLVIFDAFFGVIVSTLTVISAFILKRRIPPEEVPFKTPGGKVGHNFMVVLVLIFCLAFALLNGTDYFLGGFSIMLLIPILYMIGKWVWKGTTVKEPELYPMDPRTKLGFGDITRLGGYYLGFGLFAVISRPFLNWYEGDWGPGWWAASGSEDFDQDAIDAFTEEYPDIALPGANSDGEIWIPGYYETEYGSGLFANFDAMLSTITCIGIGAAVIGIVLLIVGKRLKTTEKDLVS